VDGIWLARPDEVGSGTPVAVKDLLDTAGLVTTYGSALFVDHVPAESAAAVRRLEAAGYAVAGKTNLHEFAYGISSQNPHFGTVPNPAFPGRLAGGSSGGSAAAVAAGHVELALGTDSAGSIRIPAAWCGVVGFKPTYGLVPVDGCFPLAPSWDVVGPIASTVHGCEELMRALVPNFPSANLSPALSELEVGIAWLEDAEPDVRAGVAAAAEHFPRRRVVALPFAPKNRADFMREAADVHRALFPGNEEMYGENVRGKIERCFEVADGEADAAAREREEYRERVEAAFAGVDLLVTPSVPFAAPAADVDELTIRGPGTAFTYPFSALGWPALALPPYVQLVGRPGQDARVLAAGRLLASLIRGRAAPR
jgi:Asp-tRNA(Asn)/Glu-tRNA(Gln) amidotransferase A subunit family amidase